MCLGEVALAPKINKLYCVWTNSPPTAVGRPDFRRPALAPKISGRYCVWTKSPPTAVGRPTSDGQLWHAKLMVVIVFGRSHLRQLWAAPTSDAQLWHPNLMDVNVFGRSRFGTQHYWTLSCLDEITSDSCGPPPPPTPSSGTQN
jgi:hypothetical protein